MERGRSLLIFKVKGHISRSLDGYLGNFMWFKSNCWFKLKIYMSGVCCYTQCCSCCCLFTYTCRLFFSVCVHLFAGWASYYIYMSTVLFCVCSFVSRVGLILYIHVDCSFLCVFICFQGGPHIIYTCRLFFSVCVHLFPGWASYYISMSTVLFCVCSFVSRVGLILYIHVDCSFLCVFICFQGGPHIIHTCWLFFSLCVHLFTGQASYYKYMSTVCSLCVVHLQGPASCS